MKELPMLFSAPMVRAVLSGTKTQTRRVLKQATGPSLSVGIDDDAPGVAELSWLWGDGPGHEVHETIKRVACPYGQPGDRLWVREAWRTTSAWDRTPPRDLPGRVGLHYEADGRPNAHFCFGKLRPGMFMVRGASRITLEVTGVRVERLQSISEADAIAEGVNVHPDHYGKPRTSIYSPVQAYRDLWESINGPGSWDANPWLWVVEFKRVEGGAA